MQGLNVNRGDVAGEVVSPRLDLLDGRAVVPLDVLGHALHVAVVVLVPGHRPIGELAQLVRGAGGAEQCRSQCTHPTR